MAGKGKQSDQLAERTAEKLRLLRHELVRAVAYCGVLWLMVGQCNQVHVLR
jgi:hypothetical protein